MNRESAIERSLGGGCVKHITLLALNWERTRSIAISGRSGGGLVGQTGVVIDRILQSI